MGLDTAKKFYHRNTEISLVVRSSCEKFVHAVPLLFCLALPSAKPFSRPQNVIVLALGIGSKVKFNIRKTFLNKVVSNYLDYQMQF